MSDFKRYLNVFQFETTLPGSGERVKFRPIVTGQIKKILLYEASDDVNSIEDILDEIINECVITKDFDIGKLYLQDRFYFLVELRKATKGNSYKFTHQCDNCNSQSVINIDLNALEVKKFDKIVSNVKDENVKKKTKKVGTASIEFKENDEIKSIDNWDIVKINENIAVKLKLLTREIQKEADSTLNSVVDEKTTEALKQIQYSDIMKALCIESIIVNGKEENDLSINDKIYFLNNILPSESDLIDEWFVSNDFGINFTFDFECQHCNAKETRSIPLDSFFF